MLERSPGSVPLLEQNPGACAAWGLLLPLAGGDFRCRGEKGISLPPETETSSPWQPGAGLRLLL